MTTVQMTERQQRSALLLQQMSQATPVHGAVPSSVPSVVSDDLLDHPADVVPAGIQTIEGDDYYWVWHTQSYKAVPVLRDMLQAKLEETTAEGHPTFTVFGPEHDLSPIKGRYPVRGIHKCLLHPDNDHRAYYDTLGLPVCTREGIPSPFQVTQHMTHKHAQEWKGMVEKRAADEKAEEREFQRSLISLASSGIAPGAPASEMSSNVIPPDGLSVSTGSDTGTITYAESLRLMSEPIENKGHGKGPLKKPKKPKVQQVRGCEVEGCEASFEGGSVMIAQNRLKKHMKEEHPDAN